MSEKIKVTICTGTHCFVMGGSDLLLLDEHLPAQWVEKVEIEGSNCLTFCEDRTKGKAPFVMIGDTLIDQATIPKIINYLETLITETGN